MGTEMIEVGRGKAGDFGGLVPAAQVDRGLGMWAGAEAASFVIGKRAALQAPALDRRGGEGLEVAGVGGAKISLGGDVQEDRFGHLGTEVRLQPIRAGVKLLRGQLITAVDKAT